MSIAIRLTLTQAAFLKNDYEMSCFDLNKKMALLQIEYVRTNRNAPFN
jgi:hypothetical protein